jgi:ABC-2 type transport system permease protein
MWRLASIELYKIVKRPRSYIGLAAIAAIVAAIHLAMYIDGPNYVDFFFEQLRKSYSIQGKIINGNLVAWLIMQTLIVQMPLLVALVTGDLISGESATGTIRLLATRPVSRTGIVTAKFIAGTLYTIVLVGWLGLLSLGAGLLLFGSGDLIVLNSDHISVISGSDTLWRFGCAFVIACISLCVVAAFSTLLSAYTDNSIGPIVATMAVVIIFTIIGTMEFPLFQHISPFLFTTHMHVWRGMFDDPVNWKQVLISLAVLAGHILAFLGITLFHFNRKDILS